MIIDQERLVDGFRGMLGMDGSRDPSQIDPRAAAYAVNCTFRGGGGPQTRPGFREIPTTFWRTTAFRNTWTEIANANYIQGAFVYKPDVDQGQTQIIVVADGEVFRVTLRSRSVEKLTISGTSIVLAPAARVYFCHAEQFLIIQDGVSDPVVYNGSSLKRASSYGLPSVPIGKQMVYGQGRLFVAVNSGSEIVAGDLVYGGSTTSVDIITSSAAFPTVFTARTEHKFSVGDSITIYGHSSTPPVNGSYVVSDVPTPSTFSVPAAVASPGYGGVVSRYNAGSREDLLRFTETTFLAEGGAFSIPSDMGKIKAMSFVPSQDTATGQGELVVLCEKGAVSFQVAVPRDQWKSTTAFQRVLYTDIGSVGETTQTVNGDLFFRSADGNGIRSYRDARAEFTSYGQTPLSAEIDPILSKDTLWLLDGVSFAYFDDRLLMTCWPRAYPVTATGNGDDNVRAEALVQRATPVAFTGIAALDFRSTASNSDKTAAVFDGVWVGLRVITLLSGDFEGEQRVFALCWDTAATESGGVVSLWEVTKSARHDVSQANGVRRISASVIPRAFSFEQDKNQKKLLRADLWFDGIDGTVDYAVSYRPDTAAMWIAWDVSAACFTTSTPARTTSFSAGTSPAYYEPGYAVLRSVTPSAEDENPVLQLPSNLGYEFLLKIEWTGPARLNRILLHALKLTEQVGGGT